MESGGGSNYLCLPMDPEWGQYEGYRGESYRSFVYGSEYEPNLDIFPFTASSPYIYSLKSQDVPCVVCRSDTRSSALMIPAKLTCHDGWTREYSGYLMTSRTGIPSSMEYVCVDGSPDVVSRGARDTNGALFYLVGGICGALSCPPYVSYRELTCVVCTK